MSEQTLADMPVDLPKRVPRISILEVVPPAFQVPIQPLNQLRYRLMTLMTSVISVSLSRSRCSAFFDGPTCKYRLPRPYRSRYQQNVKPRKSRLAFSSPSLITRVLSRLITRLNPCSRFDSIQPYRRLPG